MDYLNKIICADVMGGLKQLPDDSIDLVMFSPPYYGLRNYGIEGQMGLEPTFKEFLDKMMEVMKEVKRVLKPTGQIWVNFGDCYGGVKVGNTETIKNPKQVRNDFKKELPGLEKCLLVQPARFAIRCIDELDLILRNDIIWAKQVLHFEKDKKYTKGSVMPTSAKDRFNQSHEHLFFFTKNTETLYWRHKITRGVVWKKPQGIHGIKNEDWEWKKCSRLKEKDGSPCKRCDGTGWKKISLWFGYDYWCDLDAVRLTPQIMENRPDGIVREREWYPEAKRNKFAFNYRVRDAQREADQPQFKASEKEIKNYQGKFTGKQDAEMFNSPRARTQRDWRAEEAEGFKMGSVDPHRVALRGGLKNNPKNHIWGKNIPTIWQINPEPHNFQRELNVESEHFAVYPQALCEIPIKFGCPLWVIDCNKCGIVIECSNDTNPNNMRILREIISKGMAKRQTDKILHEIVRPKVVSQTSQNHKGIHNKPKGIQTSLSTDTSDGLKSGIYNGASENNGRNFGEKSFAQRDNSSQERDKKRQSSRQSCFNEGEFSQSDNSEKIVEKEKNNILSPLWKENQIIKPCEKCGGDIRLRHGIVCDPFCGSGTTLIVAKKLGRNFIGIELSEEYVKIAEARIEAAKPPQPKLIP